MQQEYQPTSDPIRTLSGDFHISSKLSFEEFQSNINLLTWFTQYGYNIIKSSCQTADMVKIGVLSRVRGFSFCDDLSQYIMAMLQWTSHKVHFRLYFDTLSAGKSEALADVLMIDVDRPNGDHGVQFFQECLSGESPNTPK
jgi:hypothetical protein